MKKLMTTIAIVAAMTMPAQAEDIHNLLEQRSKIELPAPPTVIPYNYTVDMVVSGREDKSSKAPFTAKVLVNPSLPAAERVTIIETSSDDYHDEFEGFLEQMQSSEITGEDLAGEFWCQTQDEALFGGDDSSFGDYEVISETDSEYVIKPNASLMAEIMMDTDGDEDMSKSERKMMKKMVERLDGEFVLSKPDGRLSRMKIWLTRPVTMAVIAKIKSMELTQSCAVAPNGFTYKDSIKMHLKAKSFGVGMEENVHLTISSLTLR